MTVVAPPGATLITDPVIPSQVDDQTPVGATPIEQPDFPEDSYMGRLGKQLGKRVEKVERRAQQYEEGDITYPELAMSGLSFGVGSVFDVVGETVLTLLSEMTPDQVEEFLKEQIVAGGTALMETETAQDMLDFYQNLDTRTKDNIGDIFTLALGAMPSGSKKVGQKVLESGVKAEKKKLANSVLLQTPAAKEARAIETPRPKGMQNTLNREDAILNTVLSLPGVTGNTSRKNIMAALSKEAERLSKKVKGALQASTQTMPAQAVNFRVTQAMSKFIAQNPEYTTKTFKESIKKVQDAYRLALRDYKGKPEQLLQLRKDFDKMARKMFKKDVHAGDDASRELVATIRNELNDVMDGLVTDSVIKSSLRRHHHTIVAQENLAYNMARDPSWVQQAVSQVSSHPYLTMGFLTTSGMFSRLQGQELLGVGLAGAGAAYGLAQPAVRKVAGATLQTAPVSRGMLTSGAAGLEDEVMGP